MGFRLGPSVALLQVIQVVVVSLDCLLTGQIEHQRLRDLFAMTYCWETKSNRTYINIDIETDTCWRLTIFGQQIISSSIDNDDNVIEHIQSWNHQCTYCLSLHNAQHNVVRYCKISTAPPTSNLPTIIINAIN